MNMKTPKILLIEDDIDTASSLYLFLADVLAEYLKIKDFHVNHCSNLKLALEMYDDDKPDVTIIHHSDHNYGFKILEKIRKKDWDSKIIMAVDGLTDELENKMIMKKVNAVIIRPYEIDEMIETINSVIGGKRL